MAILPSVYGATPMGGVPAGGMFNMPRPPVSDPLTGSYKLHNTAVEQQAGDYDSIMKGYKDLLAKTGQLQPYSASTARAPAISNLANLSSTGGYSDTDVANLRERGISPIRSIYAGANRDVDRQRALQGGYSPNYNAVKAKLAREQSESIGGAMTNVNAQLAQNIAQNKLSAASPYASITSAQAGAEDEASQFNRRELPQQQAQALQGMTSLYGTTPALASLFGNQALQGAQLQNNINQQGQQGNLALIQQLMQGLRN